MSVEMYWATEKDKQDIIEFCDYVFSKAHRPHDFATLLPKLYGPNGDGTQHHFLVRENGKLAATVLAYPVEMQVYGKKLMTIGVGSVSTHPAARGKGYMKALMNAVDERAKETGACFAVLSGLRQRYAYFGYDHGGYQMNAELTTTNVRHALCEVDESEILIAEMTRAHVPAALELLKKQVCFSKRREDAYLDILRSWNNRPFAVYRNGVFAGYGTLRQNPEQCHIAELLLEDERDFPAVMKRLSAAHGDLSISAAPWEKERAAWLSGVCEDFAITLNHGYKVYREEELRSACAQQGHADSGFGFQGFRLPLPLYVAPPDAV